MLVGFNTSLQGSSHIIKETPCQDFSYFKSLQTDGGKQVVLAAVADGVGSCSNADIGSKVAVESCLSTIERLITGSMDYTADDMTSYIKEGFREAVAAIQNTADEQQMPVITYDTTLTAIICIDKVMAFGHCGDGGIVVLYSDGYYEMITHRHKGEEATSVFPLRYAKEWEFGHTQKPYASVTLMTDGVLDSFVAYEDLENMIYFPFIQPLMTARVNIEATTPEEISNELDDISRQLREFAENQLNSSEFRSKVHDDLSLALILDSDITSTLSPICFDEADWKRKVDEHMQKQKEALREAATDQAERLYVKKEMSSDAEGEIINDECSHNQSMEKSAEAQVNTTADYTVNLKKIVQGVSMIVDAITQMGAEIGSNVTKTIGEKFGIPLKKQSEEVITCHEKVESQEKEIPTDVSVTASNSKESDTSQTKDEV